MAASYITKEGDTVDYIAYQYYGHTGNLVVEKILDANYSLAEQPAVLPQGIMITLPDENSTSVVTTNKVKLWD
ncbi:tail protein X [Acinetobacter sp. YH1901141]|uniref:tail protein X n=1 Tax=Acinetobacter sp. YH1901141 TaxID=2601201 RepID=UPI0015D33D5C|nr:tail protein X [Acinetobacter sp. YH1901141]